MRERGRGFEVKDLELKRENGELGKGEKGEREW